MRTKFGDAQSRDCNFRGRKSKKLDNIDPYIMVNTDIDEKKFVVFEHTKYHLSHGHLFHLG